eukprot:7581016-Pyramimonas_sp.AAC.1
MRPFRSLRRGAPSDRRAARRPVRTTDTLSSSGGRGVQSDASSLLTQRSGGPPKALLEGAPLKGG